MPLQQNDADVIIQSIGNLIVIFKKFVVFRRKFKRKREGGREEKKRKKIMRIIMIPSLLELYLLSLFLPPLSLFLSLSPFPPLSNC